MNSNRYTPSAVGFERISKEPLDKFEIFNSIAELQDYALNGPAYPGQKCAVIFSDGKVLSYQLIKNADKCTIQPIYPIEEHIMRKSEYAKYGFTDSAVTVENPSDDSNKWLLVYNYNPEYKYMYSGRDGYEMLAEAYSILHNLQLYNNNGINLMIVINGEIKYKWKQEYNFMLSSSTSDVGACIKYAPDDSTFICPLVVDATLTNYGLFPKKENNNFISLYVGL